MKPLHTHSVDDINSIVETAVFIFDKIDIAFNNAGVFRCMRAEIAAMLTTGGGVIINNASTVSHRGSHRAGPTYVAAKHGVLGLTKQALLHPLFRKAPKQLDRRLSI